MPSLSCFGLEKGNLILSAATPTASSNEACESIEGEVAASRVRLAKVEKV